MAAQMNAGAMRCDALRRRIAAELAGGIGLDARLHASTAELILAFHGI